MKTIFILLTSLLTAIGLLAGPLDKSMVSSDAKWLVHVDVDKLQSSLIGQFGIEHLKDLIDKEMEGPVKIDLDEILEQIHSLTAYGSSFEDKPEENSVLVVSASKRFQSIVDAYIVNEELTKEGKTSIKELDNMPFRTYLLGGEVYMSFPNPEYIIVSKSLRQIKDALKVIDGDSNSLVDGNSELVLFDADGFFLVASVQGLDRLEGIPPQARVLNKATGGQFSFGEVGADVSARLMLSTRDDAIASQLARIVQGMVALVSFIDLQEASLDSLVENIRVSSGMKQVSIECSYPFVELNRLIESVKNMDYANRRDRSDHKTVGRSSFHQETDDAIGGELLKIGNVDASGYDDGRHPRSATDYYLDTYWGAEGQGHWIRFEMESHSVIREVQVAWLKGDRRRAKFAVEVSEDGANWRGLVNKESSGETDLLESYNIPDTSTRWIRFNCFGNSLNDWNSIKDVRFYGEPNRGSSEGGE